MKIYYKTITRPIDVRYSKLINNIVNELDKPGYIIENQTQKSVKFKYNKWRFSSRAEMFTRVDGGSFEIVPASTIAFSYYISPQLEILGVCIAAFFGFTQDHYIFIFIVFIVVMFFIRLLSVKIVANRMMENLLIPENIEV